MNSLYYKFFISFYNFYTAYNFLNFLNNFLRFFYNYFIIFFYQKRNTDDKRFIHNLRLNIFKKILLHNQLCEVGPPKIENPVIIITIRLVVFGPFLMFGSQNSNSII